MKELTGLDYVVQIHYRPTVAETFLTAQALKYPRAPLVMFETGLAGEAEAPSSLPAVRKYSKAPWSIVSSHTVTWSPFANLISVPLENSV